MNGYVRKIGTGLCVTWDDSNFTMLKDQEEKDMLGASILKIIDETGSYSGLIPDDIRFAYLVCEHEQLRS